MDGWMDGWGGDPGGWGGLGGDRGGGDHGGGGGGGGDHRGDGEGGGGDWVPGCCVYLKNWSEGCSEFCDDDHDDLLFLLC